MHRKTDAEQRRHSCGLREFNRTGRQDERKEIMTPCRHSRGLRESADRREAG